MSQSLIYQVNQAMQSLNKIGKSRSERKRKGLSVKYIFTGRTMKNYTSLSCTFVKWAKERYGIRELVELTEEMGRMYLLEMITKGRSPYTLHTVKMALKKLEKGIGRRYHHSTHIVPTDLELPKKVLRVRRDRRAYSDEEAEKIIEAAKEIAPGVGEAIALQYWMGLRVSEVLGIRVIDYHERRGKLIVWRGKGGKLREIPVPEGAKETLKELCAGKEEMEKIFKGVTVGQLERVMKKACEAAGVKVHKTHNLRHRYFIKEYEKRLAEGKSDQVARREVSDLVGHTRKRINVSYAYAPPRIRPRKY